MLDMKKLYTCNYCGNTDTLSSFLIKKKDGKFSKMVVCELCKERFRRNTLFAEMSFFEWGLWLYLNIRTFNSPHYRFYDKVHFDLLNKHLDLMGKMCKKEFYNGFKFGKENWNTKGEKLLEELNIKYNLYGESEYKIINLKNF